MKTFLRIAAMTACVVAVSTGAFGQSTSQGHQADDKAAMQKMMDDMMPKPSDAPSTKALKDAHMKMMHAMHVTLTGNADVDFVRNMIPHHQGAIDMAAVLLKHGKNPEMRRLAEKIIKDQKKEIAEMNDWLKKHPK